jgi:SagB-type dehydrogenase family enzyme
MGPCYRRSPRLVAYWRGGEFLIDPYTTGATFAADPALVQMLHVFSAWISIDWYCDAIRVSPEAARRTLDRLVASGLLERSHRPPDDPPADTVWDQWGEAAAFLHHATRNRTFANVPRTATQLATRARQSEAPSPVKAYAGRPRLALAKVRERSQFHAVLQARRTWRRFGREPVAIADLASILGATFGVQRWVDRGELGRVMLRSSPSGGARHPIEAYVLARHVDGLDAGAYYYAPDEHALVPVRRGGVTAAAMTRMLGGQHWYGGAALLVALTGVFARKAWVYRSARAYRSLLLEAGHFCQTFCLTATARGLAPFCSGAFAESIIERTLGLDGDEEAVLYVAGLGAKPTGVRWAPLPDGEDGLGD